jgi:hypothetical protein
VTDHSNLLSKWLFLQAVITDDGLWPSTKLVAARLLDHHNIRTGDCFPGQDTVAKALGLSIRQVKYCIEQLEEKKWIRVTRRYKTSNQYDFCWHRANVTMKQESKGMEMPKRTIDDLSLTVDVLMANDVRTQEDFEHRYTEHSERFNGELAAYIRQSCEDADDHHVSRFVEDLLTSCPKSKKKHAVYRRLLPKMLKSLSPMQRALETALSRLLETGTGFLPEMGDVKKMVQGENRKMVTLAIRCANMCSSRETATLN